MGLLQRILRFIRRRRPGNPNSVQYMPADAWGKYGQAEQRARASQHPAEERAREEARRRQHRRAEAEERRRQRRAVEKERQRLAEEEERRRQWHAEREERQQRRDAEERRGREEAERLAAVTRAEQARDDDLRDAVESRLDAMVQAKDSMTQAKDVSDFGTAKWRFNVARQDYEEALDERISFTQGRRQSLMGVRETVLETIQETGSLSGTPEKET